MAWKAAKVEDQRRKFIIEFHKGIYTIAELCRQFDISRPTAYKWLYRFKTLGFKGLKEQERGPKNPSWQLSDQVFDGLIQAKISHINWGPRKLKQWLEKHYPYIDWPAASTIGEHLKKNGLVKERRLRKRLQAQTSPFENCNKANEVWPIDFKGWVLTKDKNKCEPLTITDAYSRYIIRGVHVDKKNSSHIQGITETAFREYGLPNRMRMDNGPPFGSLGVGGLTPFVVFLIKAGVIPEHIPPATPSQNGRHERMHLTMQQEVMSKDYDNLEVMIDDLQEFIEEFNFERPHEAIGNKVPADLYKPSSRVWSGKLVCPEYAKEFKTFKVCGGGQIKFQNKNIYVSRTLIGEPIGIKEIESDFEVYYGPVNLGIIKDNRVVGFKQKKSGNKKS